MNPADPQHPWQRLTAAARQVRDERDMAAPYGFSTRLAALAMSERPMVSLLERFSLRALGVATLLALLSVTAHFSTSAPAQSAAGDELELGMDDPVAALLDAS